MWWFATIATWLISAVCIISIMVGVARKGKRTLSGKILGGIVFHGITAVLTIFFLFKALN